MKKNGFVKTLAVVLLSAFTTVAIAEEATPGSERVISIGTAGKTGVYYPAGGAICRLVNRGRKEHGIRCMVESTSGSVYNLNALKQGQLELGISQTDWIYAAYKGKDSFADIGENKDLRTVFTLHSEAFTPIVRKESDIKSFDDLRGKRVNVGTPGSGVRGTLEKLMQKKGWRMSDFRSATEIKLSDLGKALCSNRVDAIIVITGHPNGLIQEISNLCDVRILNVEGEDVDELLKNNPYYTGVSIPAGMYPGNADEVKTFGVKAAMVTNAILPVDTVYQLTKAVFDNIEDFKTLHPVFATLEPHKMVTDAVVAPLHEGAVKYYREKGILPMENVEPEKSDSQKENKDNSEAAQPK